MNANVHRNPVSWWDNDCHDIKTTRNAAFKKWEQTKCPEDLTEYKRLCVKAKKIFQTKKLESFKKFVESINVRTKGQYI